MDAFDLQRLNDHDFEEVCKDLFEIVLEKRLEIFAPGKDDGIDLRYAAPVGTAPDLTIVQCKHWINSRLSSLIRYMARIERPKIVELAPDRYILAASVRLTKSGKDKLASSLAPFVKTPGDIYGLDEIVALLRNHPEVVKRHLRLWLASSAVLSGMFNKDILERSAMLADEVDESLQVYSPNESFNRARELLEETRVCLITGSPGIGKSTLARVLAAYYVAENYELIEISEDVAEGFRAWSNDRAQFFYYDDFLGQTSLQEKLNKNEDSRLLRFMKKVSTTPGKCLVLTTREYILRQAKQYYERVASHNFDLTLCVVNLSDYTPLIRAQMLYNHVSYSGLDAERCALFATKSNYERSYLIIISTLAS